MFILAKSLIISMFTLLIISEGAWIAISGLGGLVIGGFFTYITTRLTSKSTKELAIITAKNNIELAKIAANQLRIEESQNKKVDEYHSEVNGKMGKLLETTEALGKAKGKAEEKRENKEGK